MANDGELNVPADPGQRTGSLARAIAIMARLRGPGGCPWDREQTFDSIKRHTLEETYEVFDAIDRRVWPELKDELGDLLLQVLFYAQMAEEAGHFTIEDVAAALSAKLIRRHPHIFAAASAATADEVKKTWEAVKRQERAGRDEQAGFLDGVPQYVPAFLEAEKLGARAAKVGFDWPDSTGLMNKLREEADELEAELTAQEPERDRLEDELGDLLFTAVQLARHLDLEPEFVLRRANRKFRVRFSAMEAAAGGEAALRAADALQKERWWAEAKLRAGITVDAGSPAEDELHPDSSLRGPT